MKLIAAMALLLVAVFFAAGLARAESGSPEIMPDRLAGFYSGYIDKKIADAERDVSMRRANTPTFHCVADRAQARAGYFESQKDRLVSEMLSRGDLGMKAYKVDYFLNMSFLDAHPEMRAAC